MFTSCCSRPDVVDVDEDMAAGASREQTEKMAKHVLTSMSSEEIGVVIKDLGTDDMQKLATALSQFGGLKDVGAPQPASYEVKQTLKGLVRQGSELMRGGNYDDVRGLPRLLSSATRDWKDAAAVIEKNETESRCWSQPNPSTVNVNLCVGPDLNDSDPRAKMKATIRLQSTSNVNINASAPKLVVTAMAKDGARAAQVKHAWEVVMKASDLMKASDQLPVPMRNADVQVKGQSVVWTVMGPNWTELPQDFLNFVATIAGEVSGRVDFETGFDFDTLIQEKSRPFPAVLHSMKFHAEAFVPSKFKAALLHMVGRSEGMSERQIREMGILSNLLNGLSADIRVASVFEALEAIDPDSDLACARESLESLFLRLSGKGKGKGKGEGKGKGNGSMSEILKDAPKVIQDFIDQVATAEAEVTSIAVCDLPGGSELVADLENIKLFKLLHSMLGR